jgi:hypothetical protein
MISAMRFYTRMVPERPRFVIRSISVALLAVEMPGMTIEQLRAIHQVTPFRPFTIHLADGRLIDVPHREFPSHLPSGRTRIVYHQDDTFSIIDLLLVTELKVHDGTPERTKKLKG